jgi:thymidine phosphorylase
VREAYDTLTVGGPADVHELVARSAAQLLALSDLGVDEEEGRRRAEDALADGSALAAYERWISAQGGDADPGLLPVAPVLRTIQSPAAGYVRELRAREVAVVAMQLGAGRHVVGEPIDHAVGVVCLRKRGDEVAESETLAEIHARDEAAAEAAAADLLTAYEIGAEPEPRPLVLDVIR